MVLFNLAKSEVEVPVAPTNPGDWTLRLSTDDKEFGGAGAVPKSLTTDGVTQGRIRLPARSAALYRRELKQ